MVRLSATRYRSTDEEWQLLCRLLSLLEVSKDWGEVQILRLDAGLLERLYIKPEGLFEDGVELLTTSRCPGRLDMSR